MPDDAARAARDALIEGLLDISQAATDAQEAVGRDDLAAVDAAIASIAADVLATARLAERVRIEISPAVRQAEDVLLNLQSETHDPPPDPLAP